MINQATSISQHVYSFALKDPIESLFRRSIYLSFVLSQGDSEMMHYDDNELKHYDDDEEAKTYVFWDISSCPVPDGCDARLVGSIIGSALKERGYSDRLTITAIGNLIHTLKRSPHVLPALSSTGVLLNHTPRG